MIGRTGFKVRNILIVAFVLLFVCQLVFAIPNPGHDLVKVRGNRLQPIPGGGGWFWIMIPKAEGATYSEPNDLIIGINTSRHVYFGYEDAASSSPDVTTTFWGPVNVGGVKNPTTNRPENLTVYGNLIVGTTAGGTNQICLNGTSGANCITEWPTGSGGGTTPTLYDVLSSNPTGTPIGSDASAFTGTTKLGGPLTLPNVNVTGGGSTANIRIAVGTISSTTNDISIDPKGTSTPGRILISAGDSLCIGGTGAGQCQTAWPVGSGSGDITGVTAGTGLTGGGTAGDVTLSANTTYLQRRVSGTCAAGSSIRTIATDGTVTCEPDDTSGNAFAITRRQSTANLSVGIDYDVLCQSGELAVGGGIYANRTSSSNTFIQRFKSIPLTDGTGWRCNVLTVPANYDITCYVNCLSVN